MVCLGNDTWIEASVDSNCLQAPTVEEPCFAEVANDDHVNCDDVAGASFLSKFCDEAMHVEIQYMRGMNVDTFL